MLKLPRSDTVCRNLIIKCTLTKPPVVGTLNLIKRALDLYNMTDLKNIKLNEDVKNLLNFAGGIISARDRVHLQMSEHRMGVFRQETMDGLVGLEIGGIADEWLRIKRQKTTEPILPSDYILEFIKPQKSWDPDHPPTLRDAISKIVTIDEASELLEAGLIFNIDIIQSHLEENDGENFNVAVVLHSSNLSEMRIEFEHWLDKIWFSWATEEKPRRQSIKLYDSLFQIHASIHASASIPPEIIWGFGIARIIRDGRTIDMPVVEQEVEISVESSGDIILVQRDRPLTLNLKPFLELEFTNSARLQNSTGKLLSIVESADVDVTPTDFDILSPIIESVANELDAKGQILEIGETENFPGKISDELKITKSWVIFCRARSSAARISDIESLNRSIDGLSDPPTCLKGYVAPEPDEMDFSDDFDLDVATLQPGPVYSGGTEVGMRFDEPTNTSARNSSAKNDYTYFFPLPFNEDQASIIDALEGRHADPAAVVSVTGPPGTGKSHTIANILAHSMAKGQRVLVTARTAEAISVVRDKLPANLRNLVIASTGTDRDSIEALKTAVTQLAEDVVTLNIADAKEERIQIETDIVRCDTDIRKIDLRLSEIARANLEQLEFNGEAFTPMELMSLLQHRADEFSWFEDSPNSLPDDKIIQVVNKIKECVPDLAPDFDLLKIDLPDIEKIPSVEALLAAHTEELDVKSQAIFLSSDYPPMAVDSVVALQKAANLLVLADQVDKRIRSLTPDSKLLFEGSFSDPHAPRTFDKVVKFIRGLGITERQFEVTFPKYEPLTALKAAAVRGRAGQKPVPGLFNRTLKRAVDEITISGNAPMSPDDWVCITQTIEIELEDKNIRALISELPQGKNFWGSAHRGWDIAKMLHSLSIDLETVIELHKNLSLISTEARALFPVGLNINSIREGDLGLLIPSLKSNLPIEKVASNIKADLKLLGDKSSHQFFERLRDLSAALGHPDTDPQDIVRERGELTKEVNRLYEVKRKLNDILECLVDLEHKNCSHWTKKIIEAPSDVNITVPDDWFQAWTWAFNFKKLDDIVKMGNGDQLRIEKSQLVKKRERLMENLIKVRTMLGLHRRMTSSVQRAMQAFTQAVSRLGRGTGQTAPRYRLAAQREAQKVATVAPVWIMPEYRIAEQLPPDIEAFDLVIIDEASQSDITAVAALARGKQILIVGDEEQVSPTNVGIPKQKIDALRAQYLGNLPNADLIDENTSIFEITMRMFPQHHLILKEHFRCAPPIIQFSTQFYNNRLIPIRVPKASERFDPPLVDVFIEQSARKGKTNLPEAEYIVGEICQIISDPSNDQRDIGVVSLIGPEQAKLIENLLLKHKKIGPEVIRKRNIICGDARTLQGQERSIIFLSMVATPTSVIAQTKREIQQRYNVAMSRGKDRVYLVRSVELSDLKSTDIKSKLLKHFENPMPEGQKIMGNDALELCDSGFEKEVLSRLLDAGYRAKPQVAAGAYRIDIVVEGHEDRRLAIELDGDAYHGPDKWADDMHRQSILERAGWVFWRVFGSQWQSNKEYWWSHLTQTLDAMSIEPIGSEGSTGAFAQYVLVPKPLASNEPTSIELNGKIVGSVSVPNDYKSEDRINENTQIDSIIGEVVPKKLPQRLNLSDDNIAEIEKQSLEFEITENSRVTLEMEDGTKRTFVIVTSDPDPENGRILPSSPLGEALLGNFSGDIIEYEVGDHIREAEVLEVANG